MKDPLKVAVVVPYPWTEVLRGGERYARDLALQLQARGHQVEVLTTHVSKRFDTTQIDGLTVRFAPRFERAWQRRRDLSAMQTQAISAFALVLRHRYDVVWALTPGGAWAGRAARRATIYAEMGMPTMEWLEERKGGVRQYRSVLRTASQVTAMSEAALATVREASPRARRPPVVAYPGVHLGQFELDGAPRIGPPRLLFVSDASIGRKRLHLLLEAALVLQDRHPGLVVEVAGPGDPIGAITHLGERGDAARALMDLSGPHALADMPRVYPKATVTVLPSIFEAFGIALVESLACGTPVVCARAGGMTEIVDDDTIGATFEPDDVDDLVLALDRAIALAADPATPTRCRAHSVRFAWEHEVGDAHERLMRWVAEHPT